MVVYLQTSRLHQTQLLQALQLFPHQWLRDRRPRRGRRGAVPARADQAQAHPRGGAKAPETAGGFDFRDRYQWKSIEIIWFVYRKSRGVTGNIPWSWGRTHGMLTVVQWWKSWVRNKGEALNMMENHRETWWKIMETNGKGLKGMNLMKWRMPYCVAHFGDDKPQQVITSCQPGLQGSFYWVSSCQMLLRSWFEHWRKKLEPPIPIKPKWIDSGEIDSVYTIGIGMYVIYPFMYAPWCIHSTTFWGQSTGPSEELDAELSTLTLKGWSFDTFT